MTDPRDPAQPVYTSTPAEDEVSSRDHTEGGELVPQDPDPAATAEASRRGHTSAVTRDPEAFEARLQDAEYAGSEPESVADLGGLVGGAPLDQVGPGALGVNTVLRRDPLAEENVNPDYRPPSTDGPARVSQRPGDLPQGSPGEEQLEREDTEGGRP